MRVQHPSIPLFVTAQHNTHTPVRKEIVATQKYDQGVTHLRRRLLEGDSKVKYFCEDAEGYLWFND
jgi:hypothetical protein